MTSHVDEAPTHNSFYGIPYVVPAILLMIICSGCTLLPPKPSGRSHMLTLPAYQAQTNDISSDKINADLIVHYPDAANTLETYRIAIIKEDGTLDYIAGNRWADFLPSLVQQNVTETLRHQALFHTVSTDTQQAGARFRLFTTIESFTVKRNEEEDRVVIEMDIRLYDNQEQHDIFDQHISHSVLIEPPATINAIEHAFDNAFITVQQQLLEELSSALPYL